MRMGDIAVVHVSGATPERLEIGLKYDETLYTYTDFKFDKTISFGMSYLPPEGDAHSAEYYEKTGRDVLRVAMKELGVVFNR